MQSAISRRQLLLASGGAMAFGAPALRRSAAGQASPVASGDPATTVHAIAERALSDLDLRALIVRVTIDGVEVITEAFGESMSGVPATTEMHFRNGSVAISYVATLLLRLVDQKLVGLDDSLAIWLPELPDAERVTLRMLANMTAGYPDYVPQADFTAANYADPFRRWTPQELIDYGAGKPRVFEPGTNWDYAHTNYVILGLALEKLTDRPMDELLREQVLDPLGLVNTRNAETAAIPEPVLHSYSSERRAALGIPAGVRFYEESTFWDPSWTITRGAIQTTNIYDMTATAEAIGTGALLTPESHREQVEPKLIGFGAPLDGCLTCRTLDGKYSYGLGVAISDGWILQNPLFAGYGSTEAYLASRRIAIAVATTPGEAAFDDQGNYKQGGNLSLPIFRAIAAALTD